MASYRELKTGKHMTTRQPNGKKRQYEVHFHHTYAPYHPWGAMPSQDTVFPIPVARLSHVTHNEQASQVTSRGGRYHHFKPHEKVGKSYREDGRPLGESYRCILNHTPDAHTPCYQPIPDTEPVFPGYYSWWGLAVDPQTSLPWIESEYLPSYLKRPPESVYGGNAFETKLCDLLQSYVFSRGCGDIYLKVGGTLRYKREIAYVVIVCTSRDLGALNSYKPITHAPSNVFDTNGLVDDDGKVTDMARVPYFTTQYVNTYSSYETLNFAFYFCSALGDFKCPSSTLETHPINHPFCIRTKPMATWYNRNTRRFDTKWSCPDNARAQQTHANVTGYAMQVHGVSYGVTIGVGPIRNRNTSARHEDILARSRDILVEKDTSVRQDTSARNMDRDVSVRNRDTLARYSDMSAKKRDMSARNRDMSARNRDMSARNRDMSARNRDMSARNRDMSARNRDMSARNRDMSARNRDTLVRNRAGSFWDFCTIL